MKFHELLCSYFLCLSSSQEFRSACFGSGRSSVNANLRSSVCLFDESLSTVHNLHLLASGQSQVSLRCQSQVSVSGQSQVSVSGVSLRLVSGQSPVSLWSVSGQSQDSLWSWSVSGLEALLTHFVIQSETKILRLV